MTIQTKKDYALESILLIKQALTEKGVTVPEDVTLRQLAGLVSQIEAGGGGGTGGGDESTYKVFVNKFANGTPGLPVEVTISGSPVNNTTNSWSYLEKLTLVDVPEGYTLPISAFSGASSLKEVVLPNTPIALADNVFSYDNALSTINMDYIIAAGMYAFRNCKGLKSLNMPRIQTLVHYVFQNCNAITSAVLGSPGNPVTSIEAYAFSGCTALTDITVYVSDPATGLANAPFGATNASVSYQQA